MGDDDAEVMTHARPDPHVDEGFAQYAEATVEPTALELAHLLAELNFLRAQLEVLRLELDKNTQTVTATAPAAEGDDAT